MRAKLAIGRANACWPVFHNQTDSIIDRVMIYERPLADADSLSIAFHSGPLVGRHKDYEHLEHAQRKKLLSAFVALVWILQLLVYRSHVNGIAGQ